MFKHSLSVPLMVLLVMTALGAGLSRTAAAQPVGAESKSPANAEQERRFAEFESGLKGVKLVGQFTILGDDRAPAKEEYTIRSVKKLQGDLWLFNARIKYGRKDVTLPLPLNVKWAGDTPIITLTELPIPLLGTFSSRVIIYNNKYAGTWTHGEVGGHLFGVIEKIDASSEATETDE